MKYFVLNGKILELEKNKETPLPIPVLFSAGSTEFILEIPEEQYKEGMVVELFIHRSATNKEVKKVSVELPAAMYRFHLRDMTEIEAKDYLLYSCRSNQTVRLSLTIAELG